MSGNGLLVIRPSGTGKPMYYQMLALSRFVKIGALADVIFSLVELMADWTLGIKKRALPIR